MTVENLYIIRRSLAAATPALAALALAGCAATHVGEDWQCPLAQGTHCASVAAADPMVPLAGGGHPAVDGHRGDQRAAGAPSLPGTGTGRHAEDGGAIDAVRDGGRRDCPVFCRPFGWFARVLAHGGDGAEASVMPNGAAGPAGEAAITELRADGNRTSPNADEPTPDARVRLPETIGRVWIAPYVDGHGVYREASWVRVVVAPARWKRPR